MQLATYLVHPASFTACCLARVSLGNTNDVESNPLSRSPSILLTHGHGCMDMDAGIHIHKQKHAGTRDHRIHGHAGLKFTWCSCSKHAMPTGGALCCNGSYEHHCCKRAILLSRSRIHTHTYTHTHTHQSLLLREGTFLPCSLVPITLVSVAQMQKSSLGAPCRHTHTHTPTPPHTQAQQRPHKHANGQGLFRCACGVTHIHDHAGSSLAAPIQGSPLLQPKPAKPTGACPSPPH